MLCSLNVEIMLSNFNETWTYNHIVFKQALAKWLSFCLVTKGIS